MTRLTLALTLLVAVLASPFHAPARAQGPDPDRDGDGLSDFHERHKYGTDPGRTDSDGDGVPDGDWLERREFAYTVRAVVHVMKPVTLEHLNDDYQDVRLLDETDEHVELEVILYPFNSVASTLEGNRKWRAGAKSMKRWLEPGPTSDWTPQMRRELLAALKKDGIDAGALDDRELVERASVWLLRRAEYHDGFTSFITAFDEKGRPFVPDELLAAAERGKAEKSLTLEEQWRREISARGMFETGSRGSCTSSAIYMSGCLRAIGIPTRTVLCIPLVDASDDREHELIAHLRHNGVRRIVAAAAEDGRNAWTSHTFNEVWVGGRWRRLNYTELGQNILSESCLGLMIHIATFHDWADAEMPKTVGRRQGLSVRGDLFGGPNPYSTIALRDEFGPRAKVENPPPEVVTLTVDALHWTDSASIPAGIRESCASRGRFGFLARVADARSQTRFDRFLRHADLRLELVSGSASQPDLAVDFHPRCYWFNRDGSVWIYLPLEGEGRTEIPSRARYDVRARNDKDGYAWKISEGLTVERG